MIHGQKDIETGKYWNSITNKFVVKLRVTTKGKTKGNSYNHKLLSIKQSHPSTYKSYGWLPIAVTKEDLLEDVAQHWKYKHTFDFDKALAIFTLIIIKRSKVAELKKDNYYFNEGFIGIHSKEFRKWCDPHNYLDYLQFLEDRVYIRTFRMANNNKPYVVGLLPIMYKIAAYRQKNIGDNRKFYKLEYTTAKALVNVFNHKQSYKLSLLKKQIRVELVNNVYKITQQFDSEKFTEWALKNADHFNTKKKDSLVEANRLIVLIEQMKEGDFTMNPMDDYSGRFHSPFTFYKKCIRKFIRIDDEYAIEIDIKNSQFFLFGLLRSHSASIKPILKGMRAHNNGKDKLNLYQIFDLIQHFYNTYEDVKQFLDASADNTIYQVMMQQYDKKKKFVKDLCFKALFSAVDQCAKSKKKLNRFYPNVVRLCESVNTNGRYPLPQILQTLESRIYLDMVALEAIQNAAAPFITVHDAFYIKPCDTALFKFLIDDTFKKLNLPTPKMEVNLEL
jgi:hypothetical protein